MKTIFKNFLFAGAVLSVPAVLYAAIISGSNSFDITGWGTIGSANAVSSGGGVLAVGLNNIISINPSDTGTAAIGLSLRAYYPNCLVVGKYSTTSSGAPLFIVGNGDGSGNPTTSRRNALEVWNDGTVYIPQAADIKKVPMRGGISMGAYSAN